MEHYSNFGAILFLNATHMDLGRNKPCEKLVILITGCSYYDYCSEVLKRLLLLCWPALRKGQNAVVVIVHSSSICRPSVSFIHSFITICRAHYVENVESEALEAEARWSVIGKVVSF